jgi:sugar (pentulose or hexulose) kinase
LKNKRTFLAIDLGASGGKAVAGIFDGNNLSIEEVNRFPNIPAEINNHLHWDVLRIHNDILDSIKKTVDKFGNSFTSVGIDTWGVDFGLLDSEGYLLGNPFHYRDSYTNGIIEKTTQQVSKEKIFELTGAHFEPFNTVFQIMAMKEHRISYLDSAKYLLMMPNLFTYFLTGEITCEFTIATTTQLFDPVKRTWSKELINILQIPDILPEIHQPGTTIGKTLKTISNYIDKELNVVLPASHDTGSAVAAVPIFENENSMFISSGTWCISGVEVEEAVMDKKLLKYNFTNEGCLGGNYRLLKNVSGLWFVQKCLEVWKEEDPTLDYSKLTQMATEAEPLKNFIDPNDLRFLNPPDMPNEIIAYCKETNQPVPETKGEILRCALQGIALRMKWVVEKLEELTNKKIEAIRIVGGGVRNELFCKLIADATNRNVYAGPVEATSLGNILAQMIAAGEIKNVFEGREIIRKSFEIREYTPSVDERWSILYEKFLKVMADI